MSPADPGAHPAGPPFTPEQALDLSDEIVRLGDLVVDVRAELTEAAHGDRQVAPADRKALEAQLADLLDQIRDLGVELKGWAPLLVDVPVVVEGRPVLFCWLEGDRELGWYHELAHGFPGRRRLDHLGLDPRA